MQLTASCCSLAVGSVELTGNITGKSSNRICRDAIDYSSRASPFANALALERVVSPAMAAAAAATSTRAFVWTFIINRHRVPWSMIRRDRNSDEFIPQCRRHAHARANESIATSGGASAAAAVERGRRGGGRRCMLLFIESVIALLC
jgi:hypothetical protein